MKAYKPEISCDEMKHTISELSMTSRNRMSRHDEVPLSKKLHWAMVIHEMYKTALHYTNQEYAAL